MISAWGKSKALPLRIDQSIVSWFSVVESKATELRIVDELDEWIVRCRCDTAGKHSPRGDGPSRLVVSGTRNVGGTGNIEDICRSIGVMYNM